MSGVFDPVYFDPAYFDTGEGGGEITVPPGVSISGRYAARIIPGAVVLPTMAATYRARTVPGRWRAPE